MFSVEAIPDAATEASLRAQWQRLSDAGLPSAGAHRSPSNRPHVTLAVRDELAPSSLEPFAARLPLDLRLGGAVVFAAGARFVLARPVVLTRDLLELHADIVRTVGPAPAAYRVTAAGRWMPHLTLARRMTSDQVGQALAIVGAGEVSGRLEGLRVWDGEARAITTVR